MAQHEQIYVDLYQRFEKRLGQLKEVYKIESDGVPSAYEILNSKKVDEVLKQSDNTFGYLKQGHLDLKDMNGRWNAAFEIVRNQSLQNREKEFCTITQTALIKAREILGDKEKEAAYSEWLESKQSKQHQIEQEENRKQQRQRDSESDKEVGEDPNKILQLREIAFQKLRVGQELVRKTRAEMQSEEFKKKHEERKQVEKTIQERLENKKPGFFSSIRKAITCSIGAHKGGWFYDDVNSCDSSMMCERCGAVSKRLEHSPLC